jgi:hypothetical protein
MTDIQLDVTLSIVGPRQGLLEQALWPMALRVAAGFDIQGAGQAGSVPEARQMVSDSLPWTLWSGGLPDVVLVDEGNGRTVRHPEQPLTDDAAFLQGLMAEIESSGHALCDPLDTLDFRSAGGTVRAVEDTDARAQPVSWPGLLSTLSSLCQPLPSALKATWFFYVPRDALCDQDAASGQWRLKTATLCAAPAVLQGVPLGAVSSDAKAATFVYDGQKRAFCNVLELKAALDAQLDELDNYWLTIRDSRDDSLLDLAHQLDAALTPAAMLGALTTEELLQACVQGARSCTAAELAAAQAVWRDALGKIDRAEIAKARKAVIQETLTAQGIAADALLGAYRAKVRTVLEPKLLATGTPVQVNASRWGDLADLMADRLLRRVTPAPAPQPGQAGEGVTLVVGDERLRLVHESQTGDDAHADVAVVRALDEVAAVQVWARRSTDPAAFASDAAAPATWHALTAGRYALRNDPGKTGAAIVFGCSAAYVDEVLYREFVYTGSNMVCRNPLERAHREEMGEGEPGLMLAKLERIAASDWNLLAVPLRYGDHYEFAASVIDRAGGQAAELTVDRAPWQARLNDVGTIDPPQRDRLHFLRRVPVGVCNLLPVGERWPVTPPDVVLRSREREARPEAGKRSASVCLVPADDDHYLGPADGVPRQTEVRFAVEPPQIDEHTAMRWFLPPTDASRADQQAAVEKIRTLLSDVLARREQAMSDGKDGKPMLVTDPAVSAIGIRWQVDDAPGTARQVILSAARHEFVVGVGAKVDFDGTATFTVAPGSYVRIGIHPLVGVNDFGRLDAAALGRLVEADEWHAPDGRAFRAFEEDVVFVECATHELPKLDPALLQLDQTATGDIDVRYGFSRADSASRAAFAHVDRMRLSSRRWTWRNLPYPPRPPVTAPAGSDEWRRRLASGPPPELADPTLRDSAPEVVDYFDVLAEIDDGMVWREDIPGAFPREVLTPRVTAQAADDTVLFRDDREGITAADYLQYNWVVRSRYAGVLKAPETVTEAPRRIATAFRGAPARIKPPRVFAVIPLLSRMPDSPRGQAAGDGTPFLVVLDEIWFREYGIGERLAARIATVKREIGDNAEPTALRYGPLPDHNVDPGIALALPAADAQLDCFGPFGFTLDRGDDQALANATAFIVYPPPGTPAHYNLFVAFERCLDLPSGVLDRAATRQCPRSECTEALPVYTLPDSTELWPDIERRDALPLALAAQTGGSFSYDATRLKLLPFAGARGEVTHQYRYLLIVGNMVRDGGRAVDVFLPARALWLHRGSARPLGGTDAGLRACSHGLVAELLLSGRFDTGAGQVDPLASAGSLADLLKRVLPDAGDNDAPAMFRRFSSIGKVEFG